MYCILAFNKLRLDLFFNIILVNLMKYWFIWIICLFNYSFKMPVLVLDETLFYQWGCFFCLHKCFNEEKHKLNSFDLKIKIIFEILGIVTLMYLLNVWICQQTQIKCDTVWLTGLLGWVFDKERGNILIHSHLVFGNAGISSGVLVTDTAN